MGLQMSRRRNGVSYKFDYIAEKTEIFFNNFEQLNKYGNFHGKNETNSIKQCSKSTSEQCQMHCSKTVQIGETTMAEIQHGKICNLNENKISNNSYNVDKKYIDDIASNIFSDIINLDDNKYSSKLVKETNKTTDPIENRKETNLFELI